MKKILIITGLVLKISLSAQTWQWANTQPIVAEGNAICNDSQGNIFLTGTTFAPGVIGTTTLTNQSSAYLIKYNSSGTVLWVRDFSFAGINLGRCYGIAANASGDVYITGTYSGTLVIGTNTLVSVYNSSFLHLDMFIVKYDSQGNLLWAKSYGGDFGNETGNSACTDAAGNLIVAGAYSSPTFVIGSNTLTNSSSYSKYFLSKFNSTNGLPLWTSAPTPVYGQSEAYNVDRDNNGNFYICGSYQYSLVVGSNTLTSSSISDYNYFIAKYDASGVFQWINGGGGLQNDMAFAVDADGSGDVYLTGGFYSPSMVVGSSTLTSSGSVDAFVTRYNSAGGVVWSKNIGSVGAEIGRVVRAKGNGFILAGDVAPYGTCTLVIGSTSIVPTTISTTWLAEFDGSGNPLGFVNSDKGSGGNAALFFAPLGLIIDNPCSLYFGGDFQTQTVLGTYTLNSTASPSPFLSKLNLPVNNSLSLTVSGNQPICSGKSVTLTASGASNYSWSNGPTTNTIVVSPALTTTYVIGGSVTCSSNSAIVTVSVNPLPNVVLSSNSPSYCLGSSITLTANGANTYVWNTGAVTSVMNTSLNSTGVYSVLGTNTLTGCSKTGTIQLIIISCTDISDQSILNELKVFPNPVSDILVIECSGSLPYDCSLLSEDGRILLEQHCQDSLINIDTKTIGKGVYFLTLQKGSFKKVVKVIKE